MPSNTQIRAEVPIGWRAGWPCGTFEAGQIVTAAYAPTGDLVDLEVCDGAGAPVDTTDLECGELDALIEAEYERRQFAGGSTLRQAGR